MRQANAVANELKAASGQPDSLLKFSLLLKRLEAAAGQSEHLQLVFLSLHSQLEDLRKGQRLQPVKPGLSLPPSSLVSRGGTPSVPSEVCISFPNEAQQLLVNESASSTLRQRTTAMVEESVEKIASLYTQLSSIVIRQGESLQRIDSDIEAYAGNISTANRQVGKFLRGISSDRKTMILLFVFLLIVIASWVLIVPRGGK